MLEIGSLFTASYDGTVVPELIIKIDVLWGSFNLQNSTSKRMIDSGLEGDKKHSNGGGRTVLRLQSNVRHTPFCASVSTTGEREAAKDGRTCF